MKGTINDTNANGVDCGLIHCLVISTNTILNIDTYI